MLDALASLPHYADHLAPVWLALPPERRGRFMVTRDVADHARCLGLDVEVVRRPPSDRQPIMVAGWQDYRLTPGRRVVLVEHGVGQPYLGVTHPAHPGGQRRQRVGLFLCPNQSVADRNLAVYPDARAAVVGAPHLDRFHRHRRRIPTDGPICVSWHFDAQIGPPEATSAWSWYGPESLERLRDAFGARFHGHAHPRVMERMRRIYERLGIPVVDGFAWVLDNAACYVVDNSSTLYEAASVGIPVVALNGPHYRRGVEHGLRFWSHIPGPQVDHPGQLVPTITALLADPGQWAVSAWSAVSAAYDQVDGNGASRAAAAVCDWLDQETHE